MISIISYHSRCNSRYNNNYDTHTHIYIYTYMKVGLMGIVVCIIGVIVRIIGPIVVMERIMVHAHA